MRNKKSRLVLAATVSSTLLLAAQPAVSLTRPACDIYLELTSSLANGQIEAARSALSNLSDYCPTFTGFLVDDELISAQELQQLLAGVSAGTMQAGDFSTRLELRPESTCRIVCTDVSSSPTQVIEQRFPIGSFG